MELNRRNFVKLIVGSVAGIHATPLPWKLTDDIAIWTQNWPWVPVPPVGRFTHEKSVCTLCPGGCGIEVRKVDARAVKIEGRTDYPVNPGGICPLGAGGLQLLYNENIRYTNPMKRVGPRGSGQFQNISWTDALKEVAARIAALRQKGRPEALAAINGDPIPASMSLLIQRFLKAVGSPNYLGITTVEETYSMMNRLMAGSDGRMSYDLENADFILSFGCGLIEGWGAPGRLLNAWGIWREDLNNKKAKVVQVECRASNTASKADRWLAPIPGSETALALGLAHVIVKEGLYDKAFVDNYTFGFEDWTSADGKAHMGFKTLLLQKYSPETVSKITGLKADRIIGVAKEFAGAKAPIALCGKGKGDLSGSLFEFMAIQSLNALKGNINRPGGVMVHDPLPLSHWPDVEMDSIGAEGFKKPRLDMAGSKRYPFTHSLIQNLSGAIMQGTESPVDTLLVFSANPAYTLPECGAFRNALKKIPFIVSFSPYKDETSSWADLVLPDHTGMEKMQDVVWPPGLQYPLYGLSRPLSKPLYDTQHSGDVIIKMAKIIGGAVGSAFPWKSFEEALQARVKGLFDSGKGLTGYKDSKPVWKDFPREREVKPDTKSFDDMWKTLKSGGIWYYPTHSFKNWDKIFKTPTAKLEFFSKELEKAVEDLAKGGSMDSALKEMGIAVVGDEAFMPHHEPSVLAGGEKETMVPYGLINLSSGWIPSPPYLYKTLFDHQLMKKDAFIEVNPETATKYNLNEGDRVIIKSGKGELKARLHLSEGVRPGIVAVPMGFGHTAYDDFQQGKGVNPNEIMDCGRDPVSGHPVWWASRVSIKKS